jgi:electron transfer flavoprotein beta subunit
MKILVPVKRVIDANTKPRVMDDFSGVETQNVKMAANPFDEIAVEEAIRLHESGQAQEVVVVSIGGSPCQEVLRRVLAMGAHRAILVESDQEMQPLAVAKILKALVEREKPDLVIMGKQAIDDDSNQTGQMLAALLDWPQGTFASKVTVSDGKIIVEREIDGGHQTVSLEAPCVITTDLRLNVPRFTKLPEIMKAKQKKLDIISAESLGVDIAPRLIIQKVEPPPERRLGQKVESVEQLIDKLRNEVKVIE